MNDERFMKIAISMAKIALKNDDLPIGAIVVLDNHVIGKGLRSGRHLGKLDHAEMLAVHKAYGSYPDAVDRMSVYTTLEPCLMCFGTILNCLIPRIVYAYPDSFGGATRIPIESLPIRHQEKKFEIVGNVCYSQAKQLFRCFFETTDQKFWQNRNNPLVASVLED